MSNTNTTTTGYNGWSNYETWVVNLWLDNEQGSYEMVREMAEDCVQEAIGNEESDIRDAASQSMAQRLQEMHDEHSPAVSGVFADLLNAALGAVDWYEIASHHVNDVELFSAGWNMPGYMPESDPALFTSADDAREYIVSTLEELEWEEGEEDKEQESAEALEYIHKQQGEFSLNVNGTVYWVSRV